MNEYFKPPKAAPHLHQRARAVRPLAGFSGICRGFFLLSLGSHAEMR